MADQVQLSVEDALIFAKEQAYWDGYAAGAAATAEHAKQMLTRNIIAQKRAVAVPPKAEE